MSYQKKLYTKNDLNLATEDFHTYGISFFEKILPEDEFEKAELEINKRIFNNPDTESLVNMHWHDAWVASFISQPNFLKIARALLKTDKVKIFTSLIINKPANGLMSVPWHQDAAYDWPLDPLDCASLWLAFDDVTTENGAMKVALGGHKNGPLKMEESDSLSEKDKLFSTQLQRSIPASSLEKYEIIDVTMKKGHSSFHHSMLPHCSTPNTSNSRRCAFIARYCRGDAKLIKYPGMKREEYFKNFELFDPETVKRV